MRLYYHKTDGGAEYLSDKCIECADGHREGVFRDAEVIVRLDGEPEVSLGGKYAAAPDLLATANTVSAELDWILTEYQDDFPEDHPARLAMQALDAAIDRATGGE